MKAFGMAEKASFMCVKPWNQPCALPSPRTKRDASRVARSSSAHLDADADAARGVESGFFDENQTASTSLASTKASRLSEVSRIVASASTQAM